MRWSAAVVLWSVALLVTETGCVTLGPLGEAERRQVLLEADRLSELGVQKAVSEDYTGAEREYKRALKLYRRAGDRGRESTTLLDLGIALYEQKDAPRAEKVLREALPLLKATWHFIGAGVAYSYLGDLAQQKGRPQEALALLDEASLFLQAPKARWSLAKVWMFKGRALVKLGQTREALEALERSSALFREAGDPAAEASILFDIADVYRDASDPAQEEQYIWRSLRLRQATGHWRMVALLYIRLAGNAHLRGDFGTAVALYQQALQISEEKDLPALRDGVEFSLGVLYQQSGDPSKALLHLNHVITSKPPASGRPEDVLDHQQIRAAALGTRGLAYADTGDWSQALASYDEAISLGHKVGDTTTELLAYFSRGELHLGRGAPLKALADLDSAAALSRRVGNIANEARALSEAAFIHATLGNQKEASRSLDRLAALENSIPDALHKASVAVFSGAVYAMLKNKPSAMKSYERALALYAQVSDRVSIAYGLMMAGVIHQTLEEPQKALEFYEKAIALSDAVRTEARIDALKVGFGSKFVNSYEGATLLHLQQGNVARAFELSERGRGRAFLDLLGTERMALVGGESSELIKRDQALMGELLKLEQRIREAQSGARSSAGEQELKKLLAQREALQSESEALLVRIKATHPRYASLQSVESIGLSQLQALLDEKTSLVSYLVPESEAGRKVVAFVITRRSIHAEELPVTRAELRPLLDSAFGPTALASLDEVPTRALQKLHAVLVKPLERHLRTPRLGIIPHGILHSLPFAALLDGDRYLGDQYTIFYLPSASTLRYLPRKRPMNGPALVMAQAQAQGFPTLGHANEEAQAIARLYGVRPLIGKDATESAFKQRVRKASLLHVAAHGEFNGVNPLFSRVILASGAEDDGALTVREIYDLNLSSVSLAVLSACQTQQGAYHKGEDIVGLTRAFLHARVPTVVASLWSVDDESAGMLMKEFHSELRRSGSKAQALQAAQAKVRARFPHPYDWAAFVLTGNPD